MTSKTTTLTKSLQEEFHRGIALLTQISDEIYLTQPDDTGSIGAHFRHNLDFAVNFLNGLEINEIDYCSRERDIRVENDREYAIVLFEKVIERLSKISASILEQKVRVRSEVQDSLWSVSSVARELEFVHSHTVHHYALISAKLSTLGVKMPREFGVAPSTLRYWDSISSDAAGA